MHKYDKRILFIYIITIIVLFLCITFALSETSYTFNTNTGNYGIDETAYGSTQFNSSNLDFRPILDSEIDTKTDNVIKIDFTVGGSEDNPTNKDIIYDIALNDLTVDCDLLSPYVKWKLVKNGEELSTGNLSKNFDTITDNRLVLTNIQLDLPEYNSSKTNYDNYSFYIWISDSCQSEDLSECASSEDQSYLLGKTLSGKIEVELNTGTKKDLTRHPSTEDACANVQKVLFDSKGGNLNISSKEVKNGEKYGTLPTPTKDNYVFDGWYLDEEYTLQINENSVVSAEGNITLYAKWNPLEQNIKLDVNGGDDWTESTCAGDGVIYTNSSSICTKNVAYNDAFGETPTPTRSGYTFDGWYTASNGGTEVTESTIIDMSIYDIIYAHWTVAPKYTLTFNSNNLFYGLDDVSTTTTSGKMKYTISSGVVTVTSTADDGYGYTPGRVYLEAGTTYYFNCDTNGTWGGNGSDTVEAFLMLDGSTSTAYYHMDNNNNFAFTPSTSGVYWLRLDVNTSGKTYTFSNLKIYTIVESRTATYGTTLGSVPSTIQNGYHVNGWYTSESGGTQVTGSTSVPNGNTTYYANVSYTKVNIQYYANGGSWGGSSSTSLALDSSGYVTKDGSRNVLTIPYGTSTSSNGLADWNNSSFINISKSGYGGKNGAEWICLSGCSTDNKTFNQAGALSDSAFCSADTSDCTVVLGVNWVAATISISSSKSSGSFKPSQCSYYHDYKYQFTISVNTGSVSSGKMCYASSSSTATSYCKSYSSSGETGYGCAVFSSNTSWQFYRSGPYIYVQATGLGGTTSKIVS